ncbi:hypothetical protein EK21DRAFT_96812 [Setomelanomma holmii]|uniref:Rhodopsin domain-containing protein n=1 Tax=Setomelanomma holmii TaxID=210430 RepID=A0A9P4HLV6_9PLEO|nr:hypothetical protein EK21DRAFT_96812 [Setomelanomma holmii]
MAILLQYLNLFAPSRSGNKVMWYGSWFTIVATFIAYTVFMFWTLFYCSPRRMIWFKLTPGGKCHDVNDIILSQGAFNMASDIVILLLPTSSLWQLSVPLAKKVFITLLFATGLLACVASGMRIAFTLKIAPVISQADVSHNGLFIGLWTEAEVSLGFIVACSLCLPKLIQAKGRRFLKALSYASAPWSGLNSKSRKSSLWSRSGSRKSGGLDSKEKDLEGERPMYYEEREEQKKLALAKLQPEKNRHDIYVLPSTAGNSEYTPSRYSPSRYSQDSASKHSRSSQDEDVVQTATIARQQIPRTISVRTQEVPSKEVNGLS